MSHLRRLRSEGMPPPPHTTWVTFPLVRLQSTFPAPNFPIPVSHKYRRHSQKGVNGLLANVTVCFVDQLGGWNVAWLSDRNLVRNGSSANAVAIQDPIVSSSPHDKETVWPPSPRCPARSGMQLLLALTRRSDESTCNIPGDLGQCIIYGEHQRVFGSPFSLKN